jgi:hypothetical protein
MLVSRERWDDALAFLTQGVIGPHLTARDACLLSLHLEARPLTVSEATAVLTRIGWFVRCEHGQS